MTHPAPSTQHTQTAPSTQHVTFVVRHKWTGATEAIDVPDYAPGAKHIDLAVYETIDVVYWPH